MEFATWLQDVTLLTEKRNCALYTMLCHPKTTLCNPVFISAATVLLCLSRRLAINSAQTKEEAIIVMKKCMENPPAELQSLFSIFLKYFDANFSLADLELEMGFVRWFFEGLKFSFEMPKGMQINSTQVIKQSYEDVLSLQTYTEGALEVLLGIMKKDKEDECNYFESSSPGC